MPLFRVTDADAETIPTLTVARQLNGSGDYMEVSDSPSVRSPTTAVTVAGWVRWFDPTTTGDPYNALLFKKFTTVDPWLSYAIQQNAATALAYRFRIGDGATTGPYSTANLTSLTYEAWYWLVGTWQSGQTLTLRAWDAAGTLVQTVTSAAPITATIGYNTDPLYLGKNEVEDTSRVELAGWLAHDAVISDVDLAAFRDGTRPFAPSVGYWPLSASLDPATGEAAPEPDLAQSNDATPQATTIRVKGPKATTDTVAPDPAGVVVTDVGGARFTVSWRTPEYATSAVQYGPTSALGATATGVASPDNLLHSVDVTGLQASTLYYCRAVSTDVAGNVGYSAQQLVTTATADVAAPVLSGRSATPGDTSVAITWATDEPATSAVDYGLTTGYGGTVARPSYVTSHSVAISGLTAGTLYHYRIRSIDLAGNQATSTDFTFTTAASGDWAAMMASRTSYDDVEAWYAANTGHVAGGRTLASLTPGSLTSTHDGQVIEGISGGQIEIRHNNVTVRNCRASYAGSNYGVKFDPTFSANLRGSLIEFCDVVYTPTALANETRHAMILYNGTSQADPTRSVTVRNCSVYGFTSAGGRLGNNVTWEYNWVHDFQYPVGPHANACRPAGHNVIARRNLLNEGRSQISGIYFDDKPVSNVLFEENIHYGIQPASPSYWTGFKDGPYKAAAFDIRWVNNWYGGYSQFGEYQGEDNLFGRDGNVLAGNRYLDTNALTPWGG